MIGFYSIALVITLWRGTHRPRARRELIWGLGTWFLFGCLLIQFQQALRPYKHAFGQASLAITFIDVGHGTSVLIEPPTGEIWLYDAGRMGDSKRSHQAIAQALWTMGIDHIDGLILSHADADHYNAMPGLIERFSIKRFISTNSVLNHSSPTLRDLLNTLNARGIPIETWSENTPDQDKFGCKWTVHHPGDAFPEKSAAGRLQKSRGVRDNATSLCISIQYAGRCILLPGDLEEPGTSALISAPPIDLDVLMAPHHGSLTANPKPLIAWATPETIIISGSARSVATKVFETYSPEDQQVLHTARDHALRLTVDTKGTMHWYHWSQNHWQRITEADQVP
jgi:competence protein ComEC